MNTNNPVKSFVEKLTFKMYSDDRGSLIALENKHDFPFNVKRIYYIFNTKKGIPRGFHAHRKLKQVLIAMSGSCRVVCEYGDVRQEYILNKQNEGLLIEGLVWREMHDFTPDCVLMVLADEYYNEDDYIRNYETFKKENG